MAHGLRGLKPANAVPEATRSRVVHLAGTIYQGANHTHLSELLSEREGIDLGRTTLRPILVNTGLASPRGRRPPKHRVRWQPMPHEGLLIQLDGSHHRWLGEEGPQFALLFAVDDATGAVVNALLCEKKDSLSYFRLLQSLVQRREYVIAVGNSGTGKTLVALGLGLAACSGACPWASPPPPVWCMNSWRPVMKGV